MSVPIRTIDLPEDIYRVRSGSFRLMAQEDVFRSQFVPGNISTGPRFMFWSAEIDISPMFQDGAKDLRRRWSAFVTRNQGTSVAFRIYDPFRMAPSGRGAGISSDGVSQTQRRIRDAAQRRFTISGHRLLEGSSTCAVYEAAPAYSDSVVMEGLEPNADVFFEGDLFGLGGNCYEITQDARSDANGRTRVFFMWRFWKGHVAGDIVTLVKPTARFQFVSSEEGTLAHNLVTGEASFKAVEVPFFE